MNVVISLDIKKFSARQHVAVVALYSERFGPPFVKWSGFEDDPRHLVDIPEFQRWATRFVRLGGLKSVSAEPLPGEHVSSRQIIVVAMWTRTGKRPPRKILKQAGLT